MRKVGKMWVTKEAKPYKMGLTYRGWKRANLGSEDRSQRGILIMFSE